MFKLTAKSVETSETVKIAIRENAEALAERYYECEDIYSVEIINAFTGELIFYKAKG